MIYVISNQQPNGVRIMNNRLEKELRELENKETKLNVKVECCNDSGKGNVQLALMQVQDDIFILKEKIAKIQDKKRGNNECYYY